MNWYIEALKKYAVFSGRSRRKEFWYFTLFNFIISLTLEFIDGMATLSYFYNETFGFGLLGGVYTLAIIIPSIAVSIRRLHDIGKSGWWILISFIPLIGVLVLLYFHVLDSQSEENQYGPNPKSVELVDNWV